MGYYDGETYHAEDLAYVPICIIEIVYFALLYTFIEDALALNAKVLSLNQLLTD